MLLPEERTIALIMNPVHGSINSINFRLSILHFITFPVRTIGKEQRVSEKETRCVASQEPITRSEQLPCARDTAFFGPVYF